MSWITVHVRQSTRVAGPSLLYVVNFEVEASNGIDRELFVLRRDDGAFSHVATVFDLNTYPNDPAQAEANRSDFYRVASVEFSFSSAEQAVGMTSDVKLRLQSVNTLWSHVSGIIFGVEERVVYDSAVP
jgi:hypothetical protein